MDTQQHRNEEYIETTEPPTAARRHILLVEDDASIRNMLSFTLARQGYLCDEAADVKSARRCMEQHRPELMLLDWMLPDTSGLAYLQELRRERDTRDLPIIMLSARAAEQDRVDGLDNGADDYIVKPFSTPELISRVEALMRRSTRPLAIGDNDVRRAPVRCAQLTLEPWSQRVLVDDKVCSLSPTEYRLLEIFLTHPDRVYDRRQLLQQVRDPGSAIGVRTIDVYIRRLRAALAPFGCARFVQTVHGAGYRFSVEV